MIAKIAASVNQGDLGGDHFEHYNEEEEKEDAKAQGSDTCDHSR